MEISQSDQVMLRQYLLGQLEPDAKSTERLEERLLMESDFAEFAEVIEDEIIEDYLEGSLDSADREAVEKHFLRPRQRQEKLRLARLVSRRLRSNLRTEASNQAKGNATDQLSQVAHDHKPNAATHPGPASGNSHKDQSDRVSPGQPAKVWAPFGAHGVRVWFEAAACILLIASFIYALQLRHALRLATNTTVQQLAVERERSGQFERQLQELRRVSQPATVILSLIQPGIQRDRALTEEQPKVPAIQLASGTQTVHVEVALQPIPAEQVYVRLEDSAGKTIWNATGQFLFRAGGAALLIVDVPAHGIETGEYRLVVAQPKPSGGASSSFVFNVTRL